ncbi:MAG: T9SS type A sorting domain-containing protein [Bacteroidetes bacterium]|nr:T9SS type A sorting domain-containing protein [Bacteroidota bacterium]
MKSLLLMALLLAAGTLSAQVSPELRSAIRPGFHKSMANESNPIPFGHGGSAANANKTSASQTDTLGKFLVNNLLNFNTGATGTACNVSTYRYLGTISNIFYTYSIGSPITEAGTYNFEEFGTTHRVPSGRTNAQVQGVYVVFTQRSSGNPGTGVVGSPDEFRVNIRNYTTPGAAVSVSAPSGTKTFTLQQLADNQVETSWTYYPLDPYGPGNYIEFDSPVSITSTDGRFMASVTTSTYNSGVYSDDSLFLMAPSSDTEAIFRTCTEDSSYDVIARVMLKPDAAYPTATYRPANATTSGWGRYRYWTSTPGLADRDSLGVPVIVPVLISHPASRNEPMVQSGGLTMYANYPNPAITYTNIGFDMAQAGTASIKVLDVQGRVVKYIPEIKASQGRNDFNLDVTSLDCGNYTYVLKTSQGMAAGKIQVVR